MNIGFFVGFSMSGHFQLTGKYDKLFFWRGLGYIASLILMAISHTFTIIGWTAVIAGFILLLCYPMVYALTKGKSRKEMKLIKSHVDNQTIEA